MPYSCTRVFTYDHNREEYLFVMNGQTGKIVGKPPISLGKVALFLVFRNYGWDVPLVPPDLRAIAGGGSHETNL